MASYSDMTLQPDPKSLTHQQLAAEIKGIYSGLLLVEAKCKSVNAQATAESKDRYLANEQWHALTALHRTLLYEHHDFLSATQHLPASSSLHSVVQKYSVPARMWKHAIHPLLEVLRSRLPASLDYMLQFVYIAYQMEAALCLPTTIIDACVVHMSDICSKILRMSLRPRALLLMGLFCFALVALASPIHENASNSAVHSAMTYLGICTTAMVASAWRLRNGASVTTHTVRMLASDALVGAKKYLTTSYAVLAHAATSLTNALSVLASSIAQFLGSLLVSATFFCSILVILFTGSDVQLWT